MKTLLLIFALIIYFIVLYQIRCTNSLEPMFTDEDDFACIIKMMKLVFPYDNNNYVIITDEAVETLSGCQYDLSFFIYKTYKINKLDAAGIIFDGRLEYEDREVLSISSSYYIPVEFRNPEGYKFRCSYSPFDNCLYSDAGGTPVPFDVGDLDYIFFLFSLIRKEPILRRHLPVYTNDKYNKTVPVCEYKRSYYTSDGVLVPQMGEKLRTNSFLFHWTTDSQLRQNILFDIETRKQSYEELEYLEERRASFC